MKAIFPVVIILLVSAPLWALFMEHIGPADGRMGWSPDWHAGTKELLMHQSRVYSYDINGFECVYFNADVQEINELLIKFSLIMILDHEVWILTEPKPRTAHKTKENIEYNVTFEIPRSAWPSFLGRGEGDLNNWNLPVLKIYTDPHNTDISQLIMPVNCIVYSDVEGCPKTKRTKPDRQAYVARFAFDDGAPAFNTDIIVKIALWKKGYKEPYVLGKSGFQGIFEMYFSKDEYANLQKGEMWLTVLLFEDYIKPLKLPQQKIPVEYLTVHKPRREKEILKLAGISKDERDLKIRFNEAYSHAKTFIVKKPLK